MNSEFDEQEKAITSFNKWRGIGDVSSSGKYVFRDGDFTLVHYEVDPTQNEEMDPQAVIELERRPRGSARYFPADSIQFSVSRQSVMRIGVPCVPVSKRTKRAG